MMSKTMPSQRIFLAWLPVLAMMLLLFVLSAQPKYSAPAAATVYFSGAIPIFPGIWETVIKKGAHLMLFGILALLNRRALLMGQVPSRQAILGAIVLTVLYAFTDELHQQTVVGRSASLNDIGLDFVGASISVFSLELLAYLRSAREGG